MGAKPMVIWMASPLGNNKAADPMLPIESLAGALKGADAWVEYNKQPILDSTPYRVAMKDNIKLRHMNLPGLNSAGMVRCIGRVDYIVLKEFLQGVAEATKKAKHMRMTTSAGGDVQFDNVSGRPSPPIGDGYADKPGSHFMAGQIAWLPERKSINGTIVFDGAINLPCGILKEPVILTLESGKIVKIEGGSEAREFEGWIDSFNHPQMRGIAHATYGFLPGAIISGDLAEDERIWGSTCWGIGSIISGFLPPNGVPAPSHTDGLCLNTSTWLDGKLFIDKGKILDPKLKELAKKLGK
jgi:leucyl aminopeptidase (aminopeptidase T)